MKVLAESGYPLLVLICGYAGLALNSAGGKYMHGVGVWITVLILSVVVMLEILHVALESIP